MNPQIPETPQTSQTSQSHCSAPQSRNSKWLRVSLAVAFALVLVVGFMGYLTPAMRVSWEAVASMCGF
jgi:hypothetical protein